MFTKTNIIAFIALVVLLSPFLVIAADDPLGISSGGTIGLTAAADDVTIKNTAVNILKWIMSFVGIVAIVVFLIGSVTWMTAGGNDEKVKKGRKYLINGMIGLTIAILAYAIITLVERATTNALVGDSLNI
ncbi:MAG: hypothetical protein AUJ28_01950 [Parcubacteria group bacterium CG1_02_37_51]|uniref:TrbC/VIRB2 family protein n=1 Tax=Candidatus Komeilibacteria bacterium CG_4_10_14_0_8_um_filter_37_78 TaxID=1974471 RepID=A0A2M7RC00_9BACT|nr:MAG: hypothetical protein AUJ28_01950 [Parcubacteria group bacterium CG1_02_37_51]PIY94204.1 MAG: hypothetical protein COY67_02995 [Candidatus Komeilibacteria bacterium CG_4_10_14_0_8_um_filter_37_78]